MTPDQLLTQLATLPAEALLPVGWVREQLGAIQARSTCTGVVPAQGAVPGPDLTVRQVAQRFGRKEPTARDWCEQGLFPGAYKFRNREWRVPLTAVLAFETDQRGAGAQGTRRAGVRVTPLQRLSKRQA